MRSHTAWLFALSLLVLTACPEMHRRGGWADRAADKDARARLEKNGCTREVYKAYCEDDEESQACLDHCGE